MKNKKSDTVDLWGSLSPKDLLPTSSPLEEEPILLLEPKIPASESLEKPAPSVKDWDEPADSKQRTQIGPHSELSLAGEAARKEIEARTQTPSPNKKPLFPPEELPWESKPKTHLTPESIAITTAPRTPSPAPKKGVRETSEYPVPTVVSGDDLLPAEDFFPSDVSLSDSLASIATTGSASPAVTQEDERVSDEVMLRGLLAELARYCSRACCFLLRGELVIGHEARGLGRISERVRDVLFPADAPSVFSQVLRSHQPYHGPLPTTAMDQIIAACLGEDIPLKISVYPVLQGEHVVSIFYLDFLTKSETNEEHGAIEQLMARANLLEYRWEMPGLHQLLKQIQE